MKQTEPHSHQALKEFFLASLAQLLFLAWIFRGPILSRGVDALEQPAAAPPQALSSLSDMDYELQPALFTQTRLIKQGIFPSWSPDSQGGTPLIGKMQNAVFAPYHVLLYVFPIAWMPLLLTLVIALKDYLAMTFCYLYARSLRVGLAGGILAGALFLCLQMISGGLFAWSGSGLYLPLFLLLVELYFHGRRRLAELLLPWAVALPIFAGHFETSFWLCAAGAACFAVRLWLEPAILSPEKPRRAFQFLGLMLAGLALAAVQIAPAVEYVERSFNRFWHGPQVFDTWNNETVFKHLSLADVPLLAFGWGSLIGAGWLLRAGLKQKTSLWKRGLLCLAAALSGALALGSLGDLGLDDSLSGLIFPISSVSIWHWVFSLLLIFLALHEWTRTRETGAKILGGLMFAGALILLRLPPLSNLLLHVPLCGNFHNAERRWEFQLGLRAYLSINLT